jgi:protein-S-isoprenylcysteine O-methyltransferase Ste14
MRRPVSRTVASTVQAVVFPALFVGAPVALSELGKRHGWSAGRPGAANLVGVIPLGAGATLLVWAISSHYRNAPQGWKISFAQDYLLESGPYRFSRNPMYVGEAAIWTGWAILFGSVPVATGLLVIAGVQAVSVRVEERALKRRWGAAYDAYRERVPRWIKMPRLSESGRGAS